MWWNQQYSLQQVHAAISKVKGNPSLARLLERLKEYPNIPRKKAKFEVYKLFLNIKY